MKPLAWLAGYAVSVIVLISVYPRIVQANEPGQPIELTIATTHTANIPWVYAIKSYFVPEFIRRTRGPHGDRYRWREIYGGALSKWRDTLETVEVGLTDVGWVGTLWEPAKMPLQNITYHLPFITDDLMVLVNSFNQIHRELDAARDAWHTHNQVFLGASGVDTYHLMTRFPVTTLDDLKGRKILAPGTSAVWLEGTGAVPVNGALPTYYTQLRTGVADGLLTILTGAHPYRIHEVAPYITLVGVGAQITGGLSVNRDVWSRLPSEDQNVLRELGELSSEVSTRETLRRYDNALATMAAEGATVSTLPAIEKQRWIDGLPAYGKHWVERNEAKGLPAAKMLAMLMNSVRAAGLEPQRHWDREL